MEKLVLTAKTAQVLEILKDNGEAMFAVEVADEDPATFTSGQRSVGPLLERLAKLELVEKGKASRQVIDNKSGAEVTREYTTYQINDAGMAAEYEIKA